MHTNCIHGHTPHAHTHTHKTTHNHTQTHTHHKNVSIQVVCLMETEERKMTVGRREEVGFQFWFERGEWCGMPDCFPIHWGGCCFCFWQNQLSLPTLFHSVLVSVSVFMAISTVFHPYIFLTTLLSHCSSGLISALFVLWAIYFFLMKVSFSPDIILCGWLGLKHQPTN